MCIEFPLNEIAAIRAIRAEELPLRPADLMAHTIEAANYALVSQARTSDILILPAEEYEDSGAYTYDERGEVVPTTGWLVPMPAMARGSVKDSEDDATAGRCHTVTLKAEVMDVTPNIRTALRKMERHAHTLLLTLRDGRQALAVADPYAYGCQVDHDSSATIEVTMQSHTGLQWVI